MNPRSFFPRLETESNEEFETALRAFLSPKESFVLAYSHPRFYGDKHIQGAFIFRLSSINVPLVVR